MINELCQLAKVAGDAIMQVYHAHKPIDIEIKPDNTPVTSADLAANNVILAGLKQLSPSIPILSEEALAPWSERRNWQRYWLIDPLDGTKEFIKRTGEFTVNIALIEEGEPTIGVIYYPMDETLYYAIDGQAWRVKDGKKTALTVSENSSDLIIATTRSHMTGRLGDFLEQLPAHQKRITGSSIKFCLIAEGSAQLYPRLGPTSIWDTGAGQAIVEAAGGQVTDWQGYRLSYYPAPSLLNPEFIVSIPGNQIFTLADKRKRSVDDV